MSTAYHDLSKKNQVLFIQWMDDNNPDQWIEDQSIEEEYLNMLNDCYPMVSICGYDYYQGDALKELDPIAFRCGMNDWSAEEFVEIVTLKEPSRVMYIRTEELDDLVQYFLDEMESEEEPA